MIPSFSPLSSAVLLALAAPAIAHADQGPGYGGDADSLDVSWKETKDKAMAAGPPPVPSGESGSRDLPDPERMAMSPDSSSLRVDGIGFRGMSEVVIQFGSLEELNGLIDKLSAGAAR